MSLQPYRNLNGNSGVSEYEIGPDYIRVRFTGATIYVYNHARSGAHHVDQMKLLAAAGRGLATYISRHVKDAYAYAESP